VKVLVFIATVLGIFAALTELASYRRKETGSAAASDASAVPNFNFGFLADPLSPATAPDSASTTAANNNASNAALVATKPLTAAPVSGGGGGSSLIDSPVTTPSYLPTSAAGPLTAATGGPGKIISTTVVQGYGTVPTDLLGAKGITPPYTLTNDLVQNDANLLAAWESGDVLNYLTPAQVAYVNRTGGTQAIINQLKAQLASDLPASPDQSRDLGFKFSIGISPGINIGPKDPQYMGSPPQNAGGDEGDGGGNKETD
jgi:hypothetical protein